MCFSPGQTLPKAFPRLKDLVIARVEDIAKVTTGKHCDFTVHVYPQQAYCCPKCVQYLQLKYMLNFELKKKPTKLDCLPLKILITVNVVHISVIVI